MFLESEEIMFNSGGGCFKLVLIGIHSFGAAAALLELAAPSLTQFHLKTGLGQILNTKYQVKHLQSKYV